MIKTYSRVFFAIIYLFLLVGLFWLFTGVFGFQEYNQFPIFFSLVVFIAISHYMTVYLFGDKKYKETIGYPLFYAQSLLVTLYTLYGVIIAFLYKVISFNTVTALVIFGTLIYILLIGSINFLGYIHIKKQQRGEGGR